MGLFRRSKNYFYSGNRISSRSWTDIVGKIVYIVILLLVIALFSGAAIFLFSHNSKSPDPFIDNNGYTYSPDDQYESGNDAKSTHVMVNSDEILSSENMKIVNALNLVQQEIDKAMAREMQAETMHYDRLIFVGDSRFVAMSAFADKDMDVFLCEVGVSYNFLEENYSEIRSLETDKSAIILGLGINDLTQAENYVTYIKDNYFKSDIYFLTVNPVEQGKSYNIKDSDIRKFNNEIKANEGKYVVVNTYNVLLDHGYSTQDGIHYDKETTEYLYEIIKDYFSD